MSLGLGFRFQDSEFGFSGVPALPKTAETSSLSQLETCSAHAVDAARTLTENFGGRPGAPLQVRYRARRLQDGRNQTQTASRTRSVSTGS